ncbi:MAG: hypothetical protein DKM50_01755 [Candidatus Margulisiibacteriota bacterium]|nr:MAG: hypothetical protein A2X43_13390 [Candidatus Margulisbacteria bacterium GWD2_39_127]OGI04749.1 MAG: hypothetical protein A2X42_10605 [Candidatus Margulisbacteria bacterium GWF2_38_17]OGI05694.1 MAG: hypothetical protein A2X41_03190 [Candidatus Margulisbacteria bacterium GWE2_39_32]PZM83628.1 MAG: hypothetical protein DKM50_01755 [Candidatus Margulisiibacteriota bacterium]HAR62046.1 hypothetical protein [Candidatus Margulisiibacteriota bacterium]
MLKDIYSRYAGICAVIMKKTSGNSYDFLGSGFFITARGYIITSSNIVAPSDELYINIPHSNKSFSNIIDENITTIPVSLQQYDEENGLALLKTAEPTDLSVPLKLFDSTEDLQCGSSISCIGFPFGRESIYVPSIIKTIISAKYLLKNAKKILQLDTPYSLGLVGSPAINIHSGLIAGVMTNPLIDTSGTDLKLSYAIAIDQTDSVLRSEGLYIK